MKTITLKNKPAAMSLLKYRSGIILSKKDKVRNRNSKANKKYFAAD